MKYFLLLLTFILSTKVFAQVPHPVSGANIKKNSKWPSQANGKTIINVSWENPSPSNDLQRQWVKTAIENTWEAYSNVDFVGWGKADPSSKGIRIIIDNYGWPHTKGLGTELDGKNEGMLLNFEFLGKDFPCSHTKEECVKFVAVHEFGHALGFAHEQNRKDCLCNENPQGSDGDFYVTPCDLESVMNYCNPKWGNHGKLSANDVRGIQIIYGVPQLGTTTINLDEIRFIPCSNNLNDKVKLLQNIVQNSPLFKIKSFTEETKPVPPIASNDINNPITIRYFHSDDEAKAENLKKLLTAQAYKNTSIKVENMILRMTQPIPNYLEIWIKDATTSALDVSELDEIRLVPCVDTLITKLRMIKEQITNSSLFNVKRYTEETNPINQKAIINLASPLTIRFFHPDDEVKSYNLKKFLVAQGQDPNSITIENMLPRMSKLYPNYIEIWAK